LRNCNSDRLLDAARPCTFGFHKPVQKWQFSLLLLMNLPTRLCRIRYKQKTCPNSDIITSTSSIESIDTFVTYVG
jgi:phosphatidylglycerophosphate synthase